MHGSDIALQHFLFVLVEMNDGVHGQSECLCIFPGLVNGEKLDISGCRGQTVNKKRKFISFAFNCGTYYFIVNFLISQ